MRFGLSTLSERIFLLVVLSIGLGLQLGVACSGVNGTKFAIAVLVAAVPLAILASHWITRPIDHLIALFDENARNGFLDPIFPENSSWRELNSLARALNGVTQTVRHSQADLDNAYLQFIETMAQALDARDHYTAGHSLRVGAYAHAIACEMGLPAEEAETIRIAAQLHDIGKIGIPDELLRKPGPLTPEEFGLIKLHPQIGRKILEKVVRFRNLLDVVELHHENYDGTGYPYRLSGDRIPIGVRIVHVADAFDAMTTDRSYRSALSRKAAIAEVSGKSGTQFDPAAAAAFLKLLENEAHSELALEPLMQPAEFSMAVTEPRA